MYSDYFLDYASYVILERAVPHLLDGLKPVQRRILHSLEELDDGRYNTVASVVGNTMIARKLLFTVCTHEGASPRLHPPKGAENARRPPDGQVGGRDLSFNGVPTAVNVQDFRCLDFRLKIVDFGFLI
jgi:hypothetical protein